MKLYWVTTEDHDEDWFIMANNPKEAATFHEESEGYNPGDASAEEVLTIPAKYPVKVGWPTNEFLVSVGGKFISNESTRVVEINNRTFCEGLLDGIIREIDDDIFEEAGYDRLNQTKKTKSE